MTGIASRAASRAKAVPGDWLDGAATDPERGDTREDFAEHLRTEFSTFRWLLEPMLGAAGFTTVSADLEGAIYGAYACVKAWAPAPKHRGGPSTAGLAGRCVTSADVTADRPAHGGQRGQRPGMAGDGEAAAEVAMVVPVHHRGDPRVGQHVGLHLPDETRLKGRDG
jgi:hypothetical protein